MTAPGSPLRVGIVGCGLIGSRRAEVAEAAGDQVVVVADVMRERAAALAERCRESEWTADWRDVIGRSDVDAVVVATTNDSLEPVSVASLEAGLHVLCEKPLGRSVEEAVRIATAAATSRGRLQVGFTLRHHPAIQHAHRLLLDGQVGAPFAVRAAYGHGGRLGYEREWRARRDIAGGGELLDQGVHLIDLVGWFLGDIVEVHGRVGTWFWEVAPVEDNAFATLLTATGAIAMIHSSWTQWKNLFRLELIGSGGVLVVEGLGGSYGEERAELHKRPEAFGAPTTEKWSFPDSDRAWADEWGDFRSCVVEGRQPLATAADGLQAARVVDAIYRSSSSGHAVAIETPIAAP